MHTINCNGHLIDLSTPHVMGIVNVTPDSFYDGGKLKSDIDLLQQVNKMLADGATFIDIGGYSSRPDGMDITVDEELNRVIPMIDILIKEFKDLNLSIDSFRSRVVDQAIQHGVNIVNDISAGMIDEKMIETVAQHRVPYIMMHMRGTPQTMRSLNKYNNLIKDINFYFSERIATARAAGIDDIIIDPGYGFAKTVNQNYHLLQNQGLVKLHNVPILSGISRKSMIYKTLDIKATQALNGTSALHMICLQQGASILRVHDVNEAMEVIKLYHMIEAN
ncbi:dihydropteroate synthase [Nonlabens arenilitoris]|uniref:Dihydropteroate synthase n=1 Tax=Nonlabens arenilitoris TaxID=1217969 RepID=A0A2S7UCP6_9FLAO|nr:dihydropteroate synthase [Nonlabens arenilitoris]PQJ32022.1 dihydropteroate synthase [Nonlabens arenilitoris]